MVVKKSFLLNLAILLSFFPSTLFFLFPNNQIQPVYVIPCIIALLGTKLYFIQKDIIPVLVLFMWLFIYFLISLSITNQNLFIIIMNYVSYLSPLILLIALRQNPINFRPGIVFFCLVLWCLVSLHQRFVPVNLIGNLVQEVLQYFIADRFTMYQVSEATGRGASGLTAEPAGAAIIFMQFVFFYRYFCQKQVFNLNQKIIWLLLMSALALCIISGTLAILMLTFMIGNFISSTKKLRFLSLSCAYLLSCIVLYQLNLLGRVGRIVDDLVENLSWLVDTNIFYALTFFMGLRVYNWIFSYGSLSNNFGLGHLIAGWNDQEVMLNVIQRIGWYPNDFAEYTNRTYDGTLIKPWSYGSIISFDLGVAGLICLAAFALMVLKVTKRVFLADVLCGFVIIFFFPPVTAASPWIIIAFSHERKKQVGTNIS